MRGRGEVLLVFHIAIKNKNGYRRFWKYWPVFWGGEGDFFLLSVTQKETGEAYLEFKGKYMNGLILDA